MTAMVKGAWVTARVSRSEGPPYSLRCPKATMASSAHGRENRRFMTAHMTFDPATHPAAAPRRPLKVVLFGFGTVGASVARILADRSELADRIQLTHVFNRDVARKRVPWVASSVTWTQDLDEALASHPDVVVEVMGGIEDPYLIVRRALMQGASVVT